VRWSGQSRAIQRFGAVNRKLRSPVASSARDLPLREPVRSAILPQNQPQSGECRLNAVAALSICFTLEPGSRLYAQGPYQQ
jgi:hypothetical protein